MTLSLFHSATANWFRQHLGEPVAAQTLAWPAIRQGKNTLIAAPTGSGKTLAAFYAAVDELVRQGLDNELDDCTRIVYVSPLKALGNDIQRNLEQPLDGIAQQLHLQGLPPVNITAAVRTGDTSPHERQKMLKKPPHILVTTPESLYLLLTSRGGRTMLATVSTIIIDEIHAMLGDKRGSHLSLSVERLERLTGRPLQRIGLSATQKPVELVANFLVGNRNINAGRAVCEIIDTGHRKQLDLSLEVPASPLSALMSNEVWEELYGRLVNLVESHTTTLVFVNTRRLAERLALSLGERLGEGRVSSHHGSMSKEHRHSAEQKLKSGQLRVLVATASMELGIDIGSVDLVVQFSSPHSIAAFLQRVGRSSHQVGGVPKGKLFPLTRDDLVECTALLEAISRGDLDRIVMPQMPLDILAQQIVAEVASLAESEDSISEDELFALIKGSWVYRDLSREDFDQVVMMLAEGYSTRRGRSGSYLHLDRINHLVRPRKSARLTALTNGGAIPDMFDYQVVLDPDDTVVGSLNEDFALESLPGDIFTLGNHSWRMLRVDGLKVRVCDAQGLAPTIPFWFGEGPGRTRELSEAVSRLRLDLRKHLDRSFDAARSYLTEEVGLGGSAAEQLVEYLRSGSDALGAMPSCECIVMERFFDEVGDMHLVIHSPFGSRLNKAWGLALRKRFCRTFNFELQAAANEDSIVISLGAVHSFPLAEVFGYLHSATVREVLVQALLDAPMFEVRWRWNATRSLAIMRNRNGRRVPPQIQRMQAEDLVAQVFPDQIACQENIQGKRDVPDHPLVNQTIRDCLTQAMDIDGLLELLKAIENQQLQLLAKDLREPSPFAQEIINARPYAFLDDAPFEERRTNAVRNRSWLDPAESSDFSILDQTAIDRVRVEACPWIRSAEELHDALLTMGFISHAEMSCGPEQQSKLIHLEPLLASGRVSCLKHGSLKLWVAAERLPQFQSLSHPWHQDPVLDLPSAISGQNWTEETALREIVRGRLEGLGPLTLTVLASSLDLPEHSVLAALLALEAEGFVIRGRFSSTLPALTDKQEEWCERRLLQRIHRYTIESHRESIKPVSLQAYMQFLFELHAIRPLCETVDKAALADQHMLLDTMRRLDGFTAQAASWEADIIPARFPHYDPAWLDFLCSSGQLTWGRLLPVRNSSVDSVRTFSGPVKATPVNIMQRENLALWQKLHGISGGERSLRLSSNAQSVLNVLQQQGACFFPDIVSRARLLASQVEQALAELVHAGHINSDSYSGLRALLTPSSHKPGKRRQGTGRVQTMFRIEEAGRWSPLDQPDAGQAAELTEQELTRLVHIYLNRWGVVCRKVLEKESIAPPWRQLLMQLRRMELRGELRGGRFVAGIGGEQFALPETVKSLRAWHQRSQQDTGSHSRVVVSATDPLNLLGILLPEKKVPHIASNRVLFENGIPIAVLEKDQVRFLRPTEQTQQWSLEQLLQQRVFPPRLRAYLGKAFH